MIVAIEGLDGVGKTTVARKVADALGWRFQEKPLQLILEAKDAGSIQTYRTVTGRVNALPDPFPRLMFYALGSVLAAQHHGPSDFVIDRFLGSNFVNNQDSLAADLVRVVLRKIGTPMLTIVLHASREARTARMLARDSTDPDLNRIDEGPAQHEAMIAFLVDLEIPHVVLDTSAREVEEVVSMVLAAIRSRED